MSYSSMITVFGAAALGLIKKKIGSSSRIVKDDLKLIFIDQRGINVSYLQPIEFNLTVEDEQIKDQLHDNRLILFPVENSKIIKRAGLYLNWIGLDFDEEDDPEFGLVYDAYFQYVMEPYDQSMNKYTIPNKALYQELRNTHIQEAFKKAQSYLLSKYGYLKDDYFNEFTEPEIGYDLSMTRKFIQSLPVYFILDRYGKKITLNEHNTKNSQHKSKLRRR